MEEATGGDTFGHAAAENAIGVGMVAVDTAGGADGVFDGTESVREASSDGPRRIFFEPDGTPITPNDFSSSGGKLLQKPDLAAATCVLTATPGFLSFCGTSSAAPHAAGIAALVLEAAGGPANVTLEELRAAMTGASLDIEATGVDHDSGAGIVMAPGAAAALDVAVADRNGAPAMASTPADQSLAPGGDPVTLDLTAVFSDPDTDGLIYTVLSSRPEFVSAILRGTTLMLTPVAPQRAVVTVRAADPGGLSAVVAFNVVVSAGTTDYDRDNNGLIRVGNLAQLPCRALRPEWRRPAGCCGELAGIQQSLPPSRVGHGVSCLRMQGLRAEGESGLRHQLQRRSGSWRHVLERGRRLDAH